MVWLGLLSLETSQYGGYFMSIAGSKGTDDDVIFIRCHKQAYNTEKQQQTAHACFTTAVAVFQSHIIRNPVLTSNGRLVKFPFCYVEFYSRRFVE